jgi:hypothetical protein
MPELIGRLAVMRDAAGTAFVSGSGPTVVGLTTPEAAADVGYHVRDVFDDVIIAEPTTWGVRLHLGP